MLFLKCRAMNGTLLMRQRSNVCETVVVLLFLDELIAAIKADIRFAEEALEQPDMKQYFTDNFFKPSNHA